MDDWPINLRLTGFVGWSLPERSIFLGEAWLIRFLRLGLLWMDEPEMGEMPACEKLEVAVSSIWILSGRLSEAGSAAELKG